MAVSVHLEHVLLLALDKQLAFVRPFWAACHMSHAFRDTSMLVVTLT